MPLPETIEKTYLPGDQIDATELNAIQGGITANYARIAELSAPQLQWLIGKTIGDVTFDTDGVATIDGTARVFLDCRLGPLAAIRLHCRVDGDGIEFQVMNGNDVLAVEVHAGDGATWEWVNVSVGGFEVTEDARLSLAIVSSRPQVVALVWA